MVMTKKRPKSDVVISTWLLLLGLLVVLGVLIDINWGEGASWYAYISPVMLAGLLLGIGVSL